MWEHGKGIVEPLVSMRRMIRKTNFFFM